MYPSSEMLEDGKQIKYTYDKAHNIILKEILENNVVIESYNYTYDALSRLIEEKCYINNVFEYHYNYAYDKNNNIIGKLVFDSSDTVETLVSLSLKTY